MSETKRIRKAINWLISQGLFSSQKEVGENLGIANRSYLSQLVNSESPNIDFVNKFINLAPMISREWLLTGEGEMLNQKDNNSGDRKERMDVMDESFSNSYLVPLVPMSAMGGELIGFENEGVRDEDCEKVISPISGASFAVPIYGDSMEPEYPNGSRVFVKQINPSDFIAWGNVYVLDTTNGIILKVVVKSDNPDAVRCVSLNPSGRYQPFDVPKRTIRGMYRVLACVTAKG